MFIRDDSKHMSTSTFADPYVKPPLWKRVARVVLIGLHRVLPTLVYDSIYHPAFQWYQWGIRRRYGVKIEQLRLAGEEAAVQKMERVLKVMPHSLIGSPGLEHTHELAYGLVERQVEGAFVECGVAQGGCASLIAMVAACEGQGRHCWFFDSFEGLPDPTSEDYDAGETGRHIRPLPRGSCLGTYEQVSELLFGKFKLSRQSITLVKGWFQDTLAQRAQQVGPIALLRVDGDWYESTKCCLEALYDQVAPGGSIIIDDYCSCYGAKKATDEFLEHRRLQLDLQPDGRGGCSFQKPVGMDAPARNVA